MDALWEHSCLQIQRPLREVQYFPDLGVSNNYISIVIPFLIFKIVFHYFHPALY